MNRLNMSLGAGLAVATIAFALPAAAHTGIGATSSFMAGLSHPLGGLDHLLAMVTVGLWAALRGGNALWAWPCAFVGVMVAGGLLGLTGVAMPLVEPGILASTVVLGLAAGLALKLPTGWGAALVGFFALFHGHAHGTEAPVAGEVVLYGLGFVVATAALHAAGIGAATALRGATGRMIARGLGAVCALAGVALSLGV